MLNVVCRGTLPYFESNLFLSVIFYNYTSQLFFVSLTLQPPWALDSDFQFHDNFTDGRTPWTSDQLIVRPVPKHKINTTNIHALCTIRTHDPGSQMSEDSACLRPLGYRDGLSVITY
jgi:hypothetical protein